MRAATPCSNCSHGSRRPRRHERHRSTSDGRPDASAVQLVYTYEDPARYESEARVASDRDYAEVARAMPFIEGSVRYSIFPRPRRAPALMRVKAQMAIVMNW